MGHLKLPIKGMHCRSCELLLEEKIKQVPHVSSVSVSYSKGQAEIGYASDHPNHKELERAVQEAGYEVGTREPLTWLSRAYADYRELAVAGVILLVLYYIAKSLGLFDLSLTTSDVTYPFAFMIGLIAGVSTCMAIVGGLILGISARHADLHPEATSWEKFRPHLYFNLGRIGGYGLLGGLLGVLGGVFNISGSFQLLLTIAVGVVMVVLGLKLTGISPRLKETSITLPASWSKFLGINKHQKEYSHTSAVITGALTFFLPCGFTQAMQLAAVSSGNFVSGAMIMALFAIGTAPALLSIGGLTSVIKGLVAKRFYAIVGLAVLAFGLFNINNALNLAGFGSPAATNGGSVNSAEVIGGFQIVRMTQKSAGYSPNSFTVRKGIPVKWVITSEAPYSCASSIYMPVMKIQQNLRAGENIIQFTPTQTGRLPFSCSMGMYRGEFNVIDEGARAVPPPANIQKAAVSGVQKVTSRDHRGLAPNEFTVKAGQPVEWTVIADAPPAGCMVGFNSYELGIVADETYPSPTVIRFTPTEPGDYDVTCPMGMWRATIHVI